MPVNLQGRSILGLKYLTEDEIKYLIDLGEEFKKLKMTRSPHKYLEGKNIVLLFEKTSTRTRCSFEVAGMDLGMGVTYLDPNSSQMGHKESIEDTAKVLGRFYDGIEYRGFDQTLVEKLEERVKELKTFFILERFDNLVKNGRMKKVTGILAGALNIRPIMQGVKGEIEVFQINRGFKKSLINLAKSFGNISHDFQDKILFITESNDVKKAELFKEKVKELYNFKDIIILEAKGLSTTYADDGGIVIAF